MPTGTGQNRVAERPGAPHAQNSVALDSGRLAVLIPWDCGLHTSSINVLWKLGQKIGGGCTKAEGSKTAPV